MTIHEESLRTALKKEFMKQATVFNPTERRKNIRNQVDLKEQLAHSKQKRFLVQSQYRTISKGWTTGITGIDQPGAEKSKTSVIYGKTSQRLADNKQRSQSQAKNRLNGKLSFVFSDF